MASPATSGVPDSYESFQLFSALSGYRLVLHSLDGIIEKDRLLKEIISPELQRQSVFLKDFKMDEGLLIAGSQSFNQETVLRQADEIKGLKTRLILAHMDTLPRPRYTKLSRRVPHLKSRDEEAQSKIPASLHRGIKRSDFSTKQTENRTDLSAQPPDEKITMPPPVHLSSKATAVVSEEISTRPTQLRPALSTEAPPSIRCYRYRFTFSDTFLEFNLRPGALYSIFRFFLKLIIMFGVWYVPYLIYNQIFPQVCYNYPSCVAPPRVAPRLKFVRDVKITGCLPERYSDTPTRHYLVNRRDGLKREVTWGMFREWASEVLPYGEHSECRCVSFLLLGGVINLSLICYLLGIMTWVIVTLQDFKDGGCNLKFTKYGAYFVASGFCFLYVPG